MIPKVLIVVPCERAVMVEALDGLIQIAGRVKRYGWTWFNFGYRRTDIARNMMAHWLVDHKGIDYLCMLDSDHKHPGDIVERLVACAMADPRIKIVGGMNYRRGQGHEPMAYRYVSDHQMVPIKPPAESVLVQVDAISTSAILIHREVFEALKPPWFQYLYNHYDKGLNSSEDISFCRRIRKETDYEIWVHTGIVSPHLMVMGLADGSLYKEYLAKQETVNVAS